MVLPYSNGSYKSMKKLIHFIVFIILLLPAQQLSAHNTFEKNVSTGSVPGKMDASEQLHGFTFVDCPQKPVPQFPYASEEVTFKNNKFNIQLTGTLTVPQGNGPFPAVIMITGSGLLIKDEDLIPVAKGFGRHLGRKGLAV